MASYTITPALFPNDKQAITILFSAYTAALGLDLTFQDYSTELSSLPGKYSPEKGGILLVARDEHEQGIVGCVALRALPPPPQTPANDDAMRREGNGKGYCEMKRLYISPSARGTGLGGRLVHAAIKHAIQTGLYRGIKLDTLRGEYMASARALYRRYGFEEVERYYETPVEGTIFMGLEFDSGRQ
jgi:ribosomal protein S18 acetylase RimI-like enzyme